MLAAAGDQAYKFSLKLTEIGGTVDTFNVSEEDVAEVDAVAPAVEAAEAAEPDPA